MKHVSYYGRLGKHTAAGVGDVEVRFDFQEQIALAHALTFLHGQVGDFTAHLRAKFDERDRLDFASGDDNLGEIAARDLLGLHSDGDDLVLVEPRPAAPARRAEQQESEQPAEAGPWTREPCDDVDPMPDYENVLTD